MSTPQSKPAEHDDLGISSDITVQIKGRIKSSEAFESKKGDNYVRTLIVKPAKDFYSHPSTFPIISVGKLGKDNADVSVTCELRPTYRKTAEGKSFFGVNLWLVE